MILCLTPNPALDITYEIPELVRHAEHRAQSAQVMPGGKGINAARVLDALEHEVVVAGPLGGGAGTGLEARLGALHPRLHRRFTPIAASTRSTVTLVDAGGATAINEPGPQLSSAEVEALLEDVTSLLQGDPDTTGDRPTVVPRALLVSGSLPPGMTCEHLERILGAARAAGIPSLVDASGPALLAAARAGATMVLPNRREALEATGEVEVDAAISCLLDLGAGTVICSQGPEGMLAATPATWLRTRPPALEGNATGAGDAAAASLAASLAVAAPLPQALIDAVATSAAAVLRPVAGEIDLDCRRRLRSHLTPEEILCPSSR